MPTALSVAYLIFGFFLTSAYSQCTNGYTPMFGACYKYFDNPLSFAKAELQCEEDNGHLVSITSSSVNNYIVSFALATSNAPLWIGLNLNGSNYMWTDNTPYNYSNWYSGFPDTRFGFCVILLLTDQYKNYWINANCTAERAFVCENNGLSSSTTFGPTAGPNVCPTPNYLTDYGTIESPGYPVQYGNNLNCYYHLIVPNGVVNIKFSSDFSTERCCDVVTIYDGEDTHAKVIARLSGKDGANREFNSSTNLMLVNFRTDETSTDRGWSAYFSTAGHTGACPDHSSGNGSCVAGTCPGGFTCSAATNTCCPLASGVCPDHSNGNGSCIVGTCPGGFTCNTATNTCCPTASGACPDHSNGNGSCVVGTCPGGFTCNTATNTCCPTASGMCPNQSHGNGTCIAGNCPIGFACNTPTNTCCSTSSVLDSIDQHKKYAPPTNPVL